MEKFNYFLHCSLYLRQTSGKNQGAAETIHKSNLYIGAFYSHVCCNYNSLPWSKPNQSNGFSCMILTFMNSDMQSQIVIDTGLGGSQDMCQTYLLAGNPDTGETQSFSFQDRIIFMEEFFQKLLPGNLSHGKPSYLFLILQKTYPRESRK